MKITVLLALLTLSIQTQAYEVRETHGRPIVMQTKMKNREVTTSFELQEFCSNANQYIETFKQSYYSQGCHEEGSNRTICKSLKRIFNRISSSEGSLGSDLDTQVRLDLNSPQFLPLNHQKIIDELDTTNNEIIFSKSPQLGNQVIIENIITNEGNFLYALDVTNKKIEVQVEKDKLIFSERLSACAFINDEVEINVQTEIYDNIKDSTPDIVNSFFKDLYSSIKKVYYEYSDQLAARNTPHDNAYAIVLLGFALNEIENNNSNHDVFQKYPHLNHFKRMSLWWNVFFKTEDETKQIKLSPLTKQMKSDFYGEREVSIKSSGNYIIRMGKNL